MKLNLRSTEYQRYREISNPVLMKCSKKKLNREFNSAKSNSFVISNHRAFVFFLSYACFHS